MGLLDFFSRNKSEESTGTVVSEAVEPVIETEDLEELEEFENYDKMKKVNIKALEGNHMVPGKIYTVSEEASKSIIKAKRAVKAKESEKVGQVYDYPKNDLSK